MYQLQVVTAQYQETGHMVGYPTPMDINDGFLHFIPTPYHWNHATCWPTYHTDRHDKNGGQLHWRPVQTVFFVCQHIFLFLPNFWGPSMRGWLITSSSRIAGDANPLGSLHSHLAEASANATTPMCHYCITTQTSFYGTHVHDVLTFHC